MLSHAIEHGHLSLIIAPEFVRVDVPLTVAAFLGEMFNTAASFKADIHKPIATLPAIRMYNRSRIDVASDRLLQCCLDPVRYDFCVDHILV